MRVMSDEAPGGGVATVRLIVAMLCTTCTRWCGRKFCRESRERYERVGRAMHARAHAPPDAPPRTSASWPGVPDAHAPRLLSRWHRSPPMRFETLSTSWASVSLAERRRGAPRLLDHPASPTDTDTPLGLSVSPPSAAPLCENS